MGPQGPNSAKGGRTGHQPSKTSGQRLHQVSDGGAKPQCRNECSNSSAEATTDDGPQSPRPTRHQWATNAPGTKQRRPPQCARMQQQRTGRTTERQEPNPAEALVSNLPYASTNVRSTGTRTLRNREQPQLRKAGPEAWKHTSLSVKTSGDEPMPTRSRGRGTEGRRKRRDIEQQQVTLEAS